jgi:transcriptional regulator with XRE-family HTH domain
MNEETNARTDIADQIREGRKAAGLTQRDLAALVHTSPTKIARIELGSHSTGVDALARIAKAINRDLIIKCNI